ncbi:MAG: UvrD-helicase domain-containing protein [Rickettsiaceae bacterium]|nr:UvrD-helicase domain-containing protein [Rickettsiaceae bacterium]
MNLLQHKASNPNISTWVSASAGTGKTKILTDRVLRLLLNDADFNKILCLTFTNAAAGEMKERIASSLAKWSSLNDIDLKNSIDNLIGRDSTAQELIKARQLYEMYLRSDERINIQTIHSFCQSLLKKFPLEAGVLPNFKIIDETKSFTILRQIKLNLLNKPELELINNYLTVNFHETIIDEILASIVQHKTKFSFSVSDVYQESEKIIEALDRRNDLVYQPILQHQIIQDVVGFDVSVDELKSFFLNKDGQKRKRIVSQKIAKPGSNLYNDLETMQEQIYFLDQNERSEQLENHSKLLSILSASIIQTYESYKSSKGLLDYDDLIVLAGRLLQSSESKEWVLYKLDGGIDHLLVDEAQDTSVYQWQIIESIIEEFYAGEATNTDRNRTVFVVGDEKQSIFSFQGADADSFVQMNERLQSKMITGGKPFENVDLEISYRSAGEILEVVHRVFDEVKKANPSLFTSAIMQLAPFRTKHKGSVELWPLCVAEKQDDDFWSIATHTNTKDSTKIELAQKISRYIKREIASGRVVPSTGDKIKPSDFMILFRKRDEFTQEVIKSLKDDSHEVAGLDRISLRDNLAVLDLLSLAKFALNTEDDLNLAALLKSPLIGVDEEQLHDICSSRQKLSIWQYIQENDAYGILSKLQLFLDLFAHSDVGNFFQSVVDILGYREALNAHCGADSNDAIDEFLYSCSSFANQESTSIQSFVFWMENYDNSIKRDSSCSDKIRIMTLHASKGLQAPFVILCDTNSTPSHMDRFLWDADGKTLSAKSASYVPDYYKDLKTLHQKKAYAEYLRLLYVGMTRAEDHLIVCGYQGGRSLPENCWYELVRASMVKIATQEEDGTLIYGEAENNCALKENLKPVESNIEFFRPKGQPDITYQEVDVNRTIPSPLTARDPMGYGLVFHKILEDSLSAKKIADIGNHPLISTLDLKSQDLMQASIKRIIANKEFNELIKRQVKTEVTMGSSLAGSVQIGRVDLLLEDENEVVIIDYKSDMVPPSKQEEVPYKYKEQLLVYKKMVSIIYPNHQIRMMILWLQTGALQEIKISGE